MDDTKFVPFKLKYWNIEWGGWLKIIQSFYKIASPQEIRRTSMTWENFKKKKKNGESTAK